MAFLLLLGCGAGAYFYMGRSEASTGDAKQEAKAKPAESEGGKITYVAVPAIVLPIIDRNGISQTISLVVSLQVNNEERAKEVENNLPRLSDAYLSDMYGTLSQKAAMEYGVIKVSTLKARLIEITTKVMGKDAVDGVLLQVLQQHPT